IAEALALGTPVVCLDRGGPSELLREWPGARGVAVPPRGPTKTARAMAAAIDGFLGAPSVGVAKVSTAVETFNAEIPAAYEYACRSATASRAAAGIVVDETACGS